LKFPEEIPNEQSATPRREPWGQDFFGTDFADGTVFCFYVFFVSSYLEGFK
jgi:hypothetical protein